MKNSFVKCASIVLAISAWCVFGSWTGGPVPECANDSLAIVRVVKPMNNVFNIKPVMFLSKGYGKIDVVKMTDTQHINGDLVLKQTLTDLLSNGYTIQTATETTGEGMKLNTYYLKKKMI